jgi:methionyl-tRNA formyltransferase
MRIIFMGTPDFSVPVLQALVDAGHNVVAVYSSHPVQLAVVKKIAQVPFNQKPKRWAYRFGIR